MEEAKTISHCTWPQ